MNKSILLAAVGAALAMTGCANTGMNAGNVASMQSAPDTRIGDSRTLAGSYPVSSGSMGAPASSWSTTSMGGAPAPALTPTDMHGAALAPGRN